jgi:hypothetical protein
VCYLECDEERTGVELRIGGDDQHKLYLNGCEVLAYRGPGTILRYDERRALGLTLHRGTNVLVFKVVNEEVDWKGCVRLVGTDGRPFPGVRVSLVPPDS